MALNGNLSVSLRYSLLIALLILIIHALSSDYGVNGEDIGPPKSADSGVIGAKGSNSAPDGNQGQKRTGGRKRKSTTTSLSPLGSVSVIPGVVEREPGPPKTVPQSPRSPDAKGPLGATGTAKARKAVDSSSVQTHDDDGNKDTRDEIGGAKGGAKGEADKKKPQTGTDKQSAGLNEMSYEGEDEEPDSEEIQLNPSGNMFATSKKDGEKDGEKDGMPLMKKTAPEDVSSAGSFMTYFVVIAIVVIIGYLLLHNKKKLMAYIVEGRNTGRARRQRPAAGSGSEYKPLKNADEVPGARSEEA